MTFLRSPQAGHISAPGDANGHRPKLRDRRVTRAASLNEAHLTEIGISDLFVARFGDDLRYCAALGGWHIWNGTHWARDDRSHARECAKDLARALAREAAEAMDSNRFRAARAACKAAGVTAMLKLAQSAPQIVFTPEEADRDPWLLNVRNGSIDLRTGELRPHRREDLLTRVIDVEYDAGAQAPTFERFLEEVQPSSDVRAYLQRLFGYAAIGVVQEHILPVFWGPGANGKSVLMETMAHVLGSYARPGPPSLITRNGDLLPHPTDLASCVGARIIVVHETERGARFDASKIKQMTGGDRVSARRMREDFFEFTPSHTLIMLSNYKPSADPTDAALWRRIHLVPFDVVIPEERRDGRLTGRLKCEAAGILAWIVRGALEWQRVGLKLPDVLREQTARYRSAEDTVEQFLCECCVRQPGLQTRASVLQEAYRTWCTENGFTAMRSSDFSGDLVRRGFEKKRPESGVTYQGVGLLQERGRADR